LAPLAPSIHLDDLESTGLIRRVIGQPETEFQFRHSLVLDVAYGMLTRPQRQRLHRSVARALEAVHAGQLEDHAALLARHFAIAGEAATAIDYARTAARRSVASYAYDEAADLLRLAIRVGSEAGLAAEALALEEELADVCLLHRKIREACELYRKVLEGWAPLGLEPPVEARLHRKIVLAVAESKWIVADQDYQRLVEVAARSRARLLEEQKSAAARPPHPEDVRALATLSLDAWRGRQPPDWSEAEACARQAVERALALSDARLTSAARRALAAALLGQANLREYRDVAELRHAEIVQADPDNLAELLDALRDLGSARMYLGEYRPALEALHEAERLGALTGSADEQFNTLALQAQCHLRLDEWPEVLQVEARWRQLHLTYSREQTGPSCFAIALTACVHGLRGDSARAREYMQESWDDMVVVSGPDAKWAANQHY
jgi:hypothetical protein